MTIPRRSQIPPIRRKTPLSDWWVVKFASLGITSILAYKTLSGRNMPDSEIDIEMQAFNLDPGYYGDDQSTSRPGRDLEKGVNQRRTVSHLTDHKQTAN
jgi:hypothetical protein